MLDQCDVLIAELISDDFASNENVVNELKYIANSGKSEKVTFTTNNSQGDFVVDVEYINNSGSDKGAETLKYTITATWK